MKDFFISYNSADKSWAEWIAWQLEEEEYTVAFQGWDSIPGKNFVQWMDESSREAARTIAVLSPNYIAAQFTAPEWMAAFVQDPTSKNGKLLPVRIAKFKTEGLLRAIGYLDLVGLDESQAKEKLLQGVVFERAKPTTAPSFPGASERVVSVTPLFPGRNALKGLRPFGFEDAEVFQRLQRERELQNCLNTIADRDFRIGILFGESGCGKTSFVQAGLWPMLPQFSPTHHALYVKFSELDPLVTVRQAFKEQVHHPLPNIDNANFLKLCESASQALGKTLVLFFDQFEQFFVHFPQEEQRQPFVAVLAEWYRRGPALNVKILLCLRHDYYAHHHELQEALGYSLGPQDSMALRKFTPKQATEIFQVIAETAALTFDRSFVEEMTGKELAGKDDGRISPVDIQILAWMIAAQEEQGSLDRATFQKMGGVEGLLETYLNRVLAALATKAEQQAALKIMLALVDLDNNVRAGVLTPEQIGEKLGTEVSAAERQRLIAWLAGAKVRLLTPLEREGVWGYELAHERLIQPLRRLTNKQLTEVDQANRLLERRVNEWLANTNDARYLLSWKELRQIKRQQPYLVWGKRAEQKQALLEQSHRRLRYRLSYQALLAVVATVFILLWQPFNAKVIEPWRREQRLKNFKAQLVEIKGGIFEMGDSSGEEDETVHKVKLADFQISAYEITNQQYCDFLNADDSAKVKASAWLDFSSSYSHIREKAGRFVVLDEARKDDPVVTVNWFGAAAFCNYMSARNGHKPCYNMNNLSLDFSAKGFRLPTEAEWEYAARGGTASKGYKYAGSNDVDSVAWYSANSGGATHAVGTKQANELGLYDMSGNAWEWCQDWYGEKYYAECAEKGIVENPVGPETGSYRVLRGGSWRIDAHYCRSAFRSITGPVNRLNSFGFRVVFVP